MGLSDTFLGANAVVYRLFGVDGTLHKITRAAFQPAVGCPETTTDYTCVIIERPATYGRTEQGDVWVPFDEGIKETRRWAAIDAQTISVDPEIGDKLTAFGKTWNVIGVTPISCEGVKIAWDLRLDV